MSQVVAEPAPVTAPAVQYVPILYDPARKRKRRARRARKADPVVYVADPARRRRRTRRADPVRLGRIGAKGVVDSAVDGLGFAYLASKVPVGGSIGPMSLQDAVAVGGAFIYEWMVMKRGLVGGAIAAGVAYAVRRWFG